MNPDEFKKLVMESLKNLPKVFRRHLKDIEVVIADRPTVRQVPTGRKSVLGLYEGVPLSDRDHLYGMILPDKITIFQKNIERFYRNDAAIRKIVRRTVRHEIAHHFGITDQRLRDMDTY
ncbi:MAG: metallopeptidase family protein [Candidatus Brocadiia bacterium]